MTDETYREVCLIYNRLGELYRIKEKIQNNKRNYLTYAKKATSFGERDSLCTDWIMKYISTILDKHDKMIRQEIDDEIAALGKEIEGL